ncbi:dihydrofolate reductase [Pseudactinotalea sp. Z1748]|uniref:dihydrofolate reductase n=1 Tax=Pseudactinotalea sp. Z1748 TaxID=3413027 RepID=UPI003C7E3BD7
MLGMIWAQAHDRVIGRANDLPWHLPEDMAHFKATTHGHPVIMGRRQWESLPLRFRPLPGRRNIVLTRQEDYDAPGAEVVRDLPTAAALVRESEAWICGGGQVYAQGMDLADVLVVTEIDLEVDGDVFAPPITPPWQVVETGPWRASESGPRFRILRFERAAPGA